MTRLTVVKLPFTVHPMPAIINLINKASYGKAHKTIMDRSFYLVGEQSEILAETAKTAIQVMK